MKMKIKKMRNSIFSWVLTEVDAMSPLSTASLWDVGSGCLYRMVPKQVKHGKNRMENSGNKNEKMKIMRNLGSQFLHIFTIIIYIYSI